MGQQGPAAPTGRLRRLLSSIHMVNHRQIQEKTPDPIPEESSSPVIGGLLNDAATLQYFALDIFSINFQWIEGLLWLKMAQRERTPINGNQKETLKSFFTHGMTRVGSKLIPSAASATGLDTSVIENWIGNYKRSQISKPLSEPRQSKAKVHVRELSPYNLFCRDIFKNKGSAPSPETDISTVCNGVVLQCESAGWYPEPEVFWLDGEGNLLSAGPTETVRGPDDLYTVSSRVTVEKRHSNSFTCRVQQKDINQTRETHIQVPVELFMVQSSFALRITICLAACIMSVVAVVFILWKWGQNKINTKWHHEGETEVGEQKKYLNKTKAKLDEELEKNEGELEHVQQLITTLTEQKKDLKNQREKLISLQQEDKIKIQEYEKKLTTEPKTDKHKKKKKREMTKEFLEKRATEHEELLKNTEELLETTDNLIIRMTERKGKLEKDKEQINKYLKERNSSHYRRTTRHRYSTRKAGDETKNGQKQNNEEV
ncbi:uncharacterized protein LOC119884190 [Micropterus salmoides]|uniref:uncharacterized protein LOC119884190 n=1 Tax=Micropterus salmoides TaxID=27706 RepID=UPI0018EB7905|nr:uncharacterized protein LOC119884190 [Micropterus salmoides]